MLEITLLNSGKEKKIFTQYGEMLSEVLRREGAFLRHDCGGMGRCGKCGVYICGKGKVLACKYALTKPVTVIIEEPKKDFFVVSNYKEKINLNLKKAGFGIIIDIGTTTLCMELVHLDNGKTDKVYTSENSQRSFGADVISRLAAANNGKLKEMSDLIKSDILKGIQYLIKEINSDLINKIFIAGNTVMIYLLRSMDCEALGRYPFEITTTKTENLSFNSLLESDILDCDVVILPSVSAFVGGDIVAGGIFCDIIEKKNSLMLDMGTNGEILLNANGSLFSSSSAAGPAFEGGNISCGTGSVYGAVYEVSYADGKFQPKTIGGAKPFGICGTGMLSLTALLLKKKIMDYTGLLADEYFENGVFLCDGLTVTQNDFRQLQLAKGALRASIECIIKKAEICKNDIENIYLGGGFGFNINIEDAFKIGLLPYEFYGKVEIVGNCVLGGLKLLLLNENFEDILKITENTLNIDLAMHDEFNDLFIKYMNF